LHVVLFSWMLVAIIEATDLAILLFELNLQVLHVLILLECHTSRLCWMFDAVLGDSKFVLGKCLKEFCIGQLKVLDETRGFSEKGQALYASHSAEQIYCSV
jgi:hypothetical protein